MKRTGLGSGGRARRVSRAGQVGRTRDPVLRRYWGLVRRSREKGLPCEVTPADLTALFPPGGLCPLCGVVLSLTGRMGPSTAVIDRLYPPAGYTKANVRWICNQCNRDRA